MEPAPFKAIPAEERRVSPPPRRFIAVGAPVVGISRAVADRMPVLLEKGLFFGGICTVSIGFWMAWRPLGPIVGGAIAIYLGIQAALERLDTENKQAAPRK